MNLFNSKFPKIQGITPHIDCIPCFGDTICSLSFLEPCEMILERGNIKHSMVLEPRSLLTSDLKVKLSKDKGFLEVCKKIVQVKLPSSDGKLYATDCANTETLFCIIQSIPSPKAEPFKRWLAKVDKCIQEIEDPEPTQKTANETYKAKGHADGWIEKRMRGI